MVKLRLRRTGKKKQPSYRLVAIHSTSPRDGKFIEELGHYNPCSEPKIVSFNGEKIREWIKNGAQPSERVKKLLETNGILKQEAGKETVTSDTNKHSKSKTEKFLDGLDAEDKGKRS